MPAMSDVLIHGDTLRHAELRHELPLAVPDPFLYAELGGERHIVISSLERSRVAAVDERLHVHADCPERHHRQSDGQLRRARRLPRGRSGE